MILSLEQTEKNPSLVNHFWQRAVKLLTDLCQDWYVDRADSSQCARYLDATIRFFIKLDWAIIIGRIWRYEGNMLIHQKKYGKNFRFIRETLWRKKSLKYEYFVQDATRHVCIIVDTSMDIRQNICGEWMKICLAHLYKNVERWLWWKWLKIVFGPLNGLFCYRKVSHKEMYGASFGHVSTSYGS